MFKLKFQFLLYMPGHFELAPSNNQGILFVYKRDFVSNPEKHMEVYEESYQQKIKKEEEEKKKRIKKIIYKDPKKN